MYAEVKNGAVRRGVFDPADYGVNRCSVDDLRGGTSTENAAITRAVLEGNPGPKADAVLLNAALALVAAEAAGDLDEGLVAAREAVASGRALAKMAEYVSWTRRFADA
jgi:anthranilate phosphoribosyltransferase